MATGTHKTNFPSRKDYPVQSGSEFTELGQCAVFQMTDGVLEVLPSAGASGEVFAGMVQKDDGDISTKAFVESVVVPSSSPYTVTLTKSNLVPTQIRIYDETNSTALTEGSASNAGEYAAADSTGIVTFNSAQAGITATVTGRYYPTVAEVKSVDWQRTPNQTASNELSRVTVVSGPGAYFETDQYDAAQNYQPTAGVPAAVKTAASGLFSTAGSGTAVGIVAKPPTVDNPFLGVRLS